MSIGEARKAYKAKGQKVLIMRPDGKPVRSDLFDGLPYIGDRRVDPGPLTRIVNGPGRRPYIAAKTAEKWTWRAYKPIPGEICFTAAELAFAEPYRGAIMVEPNVKNNGHDNKAWMLTSWMQLDLMLRDQRVVQCGPAGVPVKLRHAEFVETATFRQACAVLSVAKVFIGTEGGLHHAAAAVGVPGVILFGGFVSPKVTGYSLHRNLFTGEGLGCGMRTNCAHCRSAMTRITPTMVMDNLKEIT